jgi:hypothetical protein
MLTDLPNPILNDVLSCVSFKRDYEPLNENLQIKELLFCLRQSYLRRFFSKPITNLKVALKVYSGIVWDRKLCSLFAVNQRYVRFQVKDSLACVNGRYDFLDGETVTELKIVDDVNEVTEPYLVNIYQVKFYAYVDCKPKAQVLYFDGKDAKMFPVDLSDSKEFMEQIVFNAKLFYDCLRFRQYPAKSCLYCGNCEFKDNC